MQWAYKRWSSHGVVPRPFVASPLSSNTFNLCYSLGREAKFHTHTKQQVKLTRTGSRKIWLIMTGWDYISELRPPLCLLFIRRVIRGHGGPWWWWCRQGITTDSYARAVWQSYQQKSGASRRKVRRREIFGQVGGMDEGVRILPTNIWNTSRDL
jgi:hypothetical protein